MTSVHVSVQFVFIIPNICFIFHINLPCSIKKLSLCVCTAYTCIQCRGRQRETFQVVHQNLVAHQNFWLTIKFFGRPQRLQ